jgi:DNA-directed RNA polymerase sigma subunit (sigma70/sigma32)
MGLAPGDFDMTPTKAIADQLDVLIVWQHRNRMAADQMERTRIQLRIAAQRAADLGATHEAIAQALGLTRQRVGQLLAD